MVQFLDAMPHNKDKPEWENFCPDNHSYSNLWDKNLKKANSEMENNSEWDQAVLTMNILDTLVDIIDAQERLADYRRDLCDKKSSVEQIEKFAYRKRIKGNNLKFLCFELKKRKLLKELKEADIGQVHVNVGSKLESLQNESQDGIRLPHPGRLQDGINHLTTEIANLADSKDIIDTDSGTSGVESAPPREIRLMNKLTDDSIADTPDREFRIDDIIN